ncbi:MAG: hypothetical protein GXZ18_07865 [Synergistaceae bacterium]|nr:hypothetical protein [Synergistaceae bacterium]
MSGKSAAEIAAEITSTAMGINTSLINRPDVVVKFYRDIYKEIATCTCTPLEDLR